MTPDLAYKLLVTGVIASCLLAMAITNLYPDGAITVTASALVVIDLVVLAGCAVGARWFLITLVCLVGAGLYAWADLIEPVLRARRRRHDT